MATTHELEISFDPLSDLTPTWTDLSSRLLEVPSVRVGVDGDLDEPQPGSATFRLDNRDRALEPGYAASAYFPNVRPLRRIRYRINDGSTDWEIFYGYILSWGPTWPGGMNQEAIIQAVDGTMILEMDKLPLLDPPEASTYEEVVMHDAPFAYYKLAEQAGTVMVATAGTDGVYKNTPTFGQAAQIAGDPGTCVKFAEDEYGRAVVEDTTQFVDAGALSFEVWASAHSFGYALEGPFDTPAAGYIFDIEFSPTDVAAHVITTGGTNTANITTTVTDLHHVVGTWDGDSLRLYLDGSLVDTTSTTGALVTPDANPVLLVGNRDITPDGSLEHVLVSNAAVYEHALSPDRVLAHYQAGSQLRGVDAHRAGDRIEHMDVIWGGGTLDDYTTHIVTPVMYHGQSRFEVVKDAVRAETPVGLFYFQGTGFPKYLGWDYGDTAPYNTVQATLGNNPGEVPFADVETTDEDELYNVVTVSREGGLAQTVTDTASEAEFYRRAYDLTGLINAEDEDCMTIAAAILSDHSQPDPPVRMRSVTLTSDNALALAEILERTPGDLIRVKHRPKGGTAIDIITRIRGRTLTVAPLDGGNRVISATWTLGRGFDASAAEWRLGVVGYSELQTTTALG